MENRFNWNPLVSFTGFAALFGGLGWHFDNQYALVSYWPVLSLVLWVIGMRAAFKVRLLRGEVPIIAVCSAFFVLALWRDPEATPKLSEGLLLTVTCAGIFLPVIFYASSRKRVEVGHLKDPRMVYDPNRGQMTFDQWEREKLKKIKDKRKKRKEVRIRRRGFC